MPAYKVITGADVSLSAATAKTVLALINPATRRSRILEVTIGLKSVTTADVPGLVELVQFDTDGTGTSVTPLPLDPAEPAALVTAKRTYTVEPSSNVVVRDEWELTPVGGLLVYQLPLTRELVTAVSKVIGIRCTFAQAQTCRASLVYME